jgi:hypothetical protein
MWQSRAEYRDKRQSGYCCIPARIHFALQVQEGNFISGDRGNARDLETQKLR